MPVWRKTLKLYQQRIVTIVPEDSFGISKILDNYRVETLFSKVDGHTTKMEFSHYSTKSVQAKLLNLVANREIARGWLATLNAIKAKVESSALKSL